jgi:positive regulator of sigma E activity
MQEKDMLSSSSLTRISLLVFLGVSAAGCEVVGGIFKAGFWVGAIAVILIVVLLVFVVGKFKR